MREILCKCAKSRVLLCCRRRGWKAPLDDDDWYRPARVYTLRCTTLTTTILYVRGYTVVRFSIVHTRPREPYEYFNIALQVFFFSVKKMSPPPRRVTLNIYFRVAYDSSSLRVSNRGGGRKNKKMGGYGGIRQKTITVHGARYGGAEIERTI